MKKPKRRRVAKKVALIVRVFRLLLSRKFNKSIEEVGGLPLCDLCGRFPGNGREEVWGYCYAKRHGGKMPQRGYCDGIQLPHGSTIKGSTVFIPEIFLHRLGGIQ